MVACPRCSGTGRYSHGAGHPLWSRFFGGTAEAILIVCPLCKGTRKVEDEDENILIRHPLEILELVDSAVKEEKQKRKTHPGD